MDTQASALAHPQRGHFDLGTGYHGDVRLDLDALFVLRERGGELAAVRPGHGDAVVASVVIWNISQRALSAHDPPPPTLPATTEADTMVLR